MTTLGTQIETFRNAMLSPTASASMLVAIERTTSIQPRVGSPAASPFSSFERASRSIFPPTNASRPNATQWSTPRMCSSTVRPASQPMTGIRNWKRPKWNARRKTCRKVSRLRARPAPTATARASIASPTAIPATSIQGMAPPS